MILNESLRVVGSKWRPWEQENDSAEFILGCLFEKKTSAVKILPLKIANKETKLRNLFSRFQRKESREKNFPSKIVLYCIAVNNKIPLNFQEGKLL